MMTIKIVSADRHETLREVRRVWTDNGAETQKGERCIDVVAESPTGEVLLFTAGEFGVRAIAYVMNDAGQTVARYNLGTGISADFRYPPAPTAAELTAAVVRAEPDATAITSGFHGVRTFHND